MGRIRRYWGREIAENLCLGFGCQRKGEERYFAKVSNTNVIAMMLILHSRMNTHFDFGNLHNLKDWQRLIDGNFLEHDEIYPRGMDGVLTILKDTFRVLSLEQTPQ